MSAASPGPADAFVPGLAMSLFKLAEVLVALKPKAGC